MPNINNTNTNTTISRHSSKSKKNSISKTKSKTKSKSKKIISIFNTMNSSRNNIPKTENNLSAELINIDNKSTTMQKKSKVKKYSKSVSSTYSSVMNNGHLHQEGKQVINESTKPFIQISEMHNGHVSHFMIPRTKELMNKSKSKVIHLMPSIAMNNNNKKSKTKSKSKSRK